MSDEGSLCTCHQWSNLKRLAKEISENSKKITEGITWKMKREEVKIECIMFYVNTFTFSFLLEVFQIISNS